MTKNQAELPLVSVITPCIDIVKNNREEYFHKMMKSIRRQSYKKIEHIVVDGGSTDGTIDILNKYKEKGWIDKLISEKDTGIYQAINKGLKITSGSYINIMNTDDYFIDKDVFKMSIYKLKNNDVSFTHADRIIKSKYGKQNFIKRGDERVAFFRMPFRHQTMLVKKGIFEELGGFDENYKIASDYKYVLKMLLAGKKGYYIPKIFIQSLDGGISSDRKKCVEEVSQVLYECYGKKFNLTLSDCRKIYTKKMSLLLFLKILLFIKNKQIRTSLAYNYGQQIKLRKSSEVL